MDRVAAGGLAPPAITRVDVEIGRAPRPRKPRASSATRTCSDSASSVGVDRDRRDAELGRGARDADRDLAAIGDQELS